MADYGLKMSKAGYDVKTATATQLAYSSKWSNFKIGTISTGIITIPGGSGSDTYSVSIPRPYSFSSMNMPFIESTTDAPGKWQLASMGNASGTVGVTTDSNSAQPNCIERLGYNDYLCSVYSIDLGYTKTYTFKIVVFVDDLIGTAGYSTTSVKDYGIKVSKEGFDITDTDTDMSMTSKLSNLTVYATGQVTGSGFTGTSVAHNLGYKPIFITLVQDPDTGKWRYLPTVVTPSAGGVYHPTSFVDSSNLYIYDAGGFTYKYIIFNERII